jgi:N-acetylglucosamine-6-phosphate deacetylase
VNGGGIKIAAAGVDDQGNMRERLHSAQGAAVGAGRSAASYEEVLASVPSGLTHAAHIFNATVGLHHRQPGTVGAVLTCDGITTEEIADNVHLHSVVAKLLVRATGVNRSILVTDAIRIRH